MVTCANPIFRLEYVRVPVRPARLSAEREYRDRVDGGPCSRVGPGHLARRVHSRNVGGHAHRPCSLVNLVLLFVAGVSASQAVQLMYTSTFILHSIALSRRRSEIWAIHAHHVLHSSAYPILRPPLVARLDAVRRRSARCMHRLYNRSADVTHPQGFRMPVHAFGHRIGHFDRDRKQCDS